MTCYMHLYKSTQPMGPLCVWRYFSNDQPLLRPGRLLQHELAFELSHCQRVWKVISTRLRKNETTAFGRAVSKMDVYIFSLQETKSSNPYKLMTAHHLPSTVPMVNYQIDGWLTIFRLEQFPGTSLSYPECYIKSGKGSEENNAGATP